MANKPRVYIGIGHGGSDPGAVANGIEEANAALVIGTAVTEELRRHGVEVMQSRTKDVTESLAVKINECNAFNPRLAADIHLNAGGGDGAEVFHSIKGGTGKELANNILIEIKAIGQNSRGTKTKKNSSGKDYFGFIRSTNCPAVIVECAFLDNKTDVKIVDTVAEQKAMGVAIAKGFLRQLGIKHDGTATVEIGGAKVEATYGALYRVFDKDGKQVGAYFKESGAFTKAKEQLKKDGSVKITLSEK